MVNHLPDAGDFAIVQVGRLGAGVHLCFPEHPRRSGAPDAKNIREGNLDSLVSG
jgi:hypothetical protein